MLYHVTLKSNLESISKQGLLPAIGERSLSFGEKENQIYFFKDKVSVENALLNWLGEYFEDEELIVFEIEEHYVVGKSDVAFEVSCNHPIPFYQLAISKQFGDI